jgi:hypothetical protein
MGVIYHGLHGWARIFATHGFGASSVEPSLSLLFPNVDEKPRNFVQRDSVLDHGSPLPLLGASGPPESARGLAQSKT